MDRYGLRQASFGNWSADKEVGTGDTGATLQSGKAGYTFYIQRVEISVLTPGSTKEFVLKDSNGSPVIVVDLVSASVVEGQSLLYDFGANGFPVTEGADVLYTNNGMALALHVEMYRKPTGVSTILVGNQVGGGTPGNH